MSYTDSCEEGEIILIRTLMIQKDANQNNIQLSITWSIIVHQMDAQMDHINQIEELQWQESQGQFPSLICT